MPREAWTRTTPVLAVSEEQAAELLRPAFGAVAVASVERLNGGHSNTNVRVRLNDQPDVVLRLYQRDAAQAQKEAALARLVRSKVPVARYLHVGRTASGHTYAVVEWIEGRLLQSLVRGASDDDLTRAGRDIGEALAGIHTFTFERAGFLDGDLAITPFPGGSSASGFLEQMFRGVAGERLGRDLAAEVVAFAKANEHRSTIWEHPARLTHFDFGPSNLLVREDFSLAAVLDWEFAAAASPAPDFGNLLRPRLGHKQAFVEAVEAAYREAGGFLPDDWRDLIRLADMGAWAEFLSRPEIGEAVIEDAKQTLRQTIGQ